MAQRGALSAGARIVRSRPAWIARLAARLLRPELWRPGGQREGPPAASGAGRGRTGLAGSCAAPAANSGAGAMVSAETPAQTPCGELGSGSGGSRATWGPSGTEQGRTPPLPGKAVWGQAPEAHSAQRAPCGASGRLARDWAGRWLRPQERGAWPACAVLECVPPGGEPAVSKRWHPAPQGQTLLRLSSCHRLPMLPGQLSGCSVGRLSLSQLWGQKLQPQRPGTSRRSLQWPPGEPTLRIASRPALKHPGPPEGRRGLEGPFPAPLPCPLL